MVVIIYLTIKSMVVLIYLTIKSMVMIIYLTIKSMGVMILVPTYTLVACIYTVHLTPYVLIIPFRGSHM